MYFSSLHGHATSCLARRERRADRVHGLDPRRAAGDLAQHVGADAGHDADRGDGVGAVGDLHADVRERAADRAHRERHDVHRAAAHAALEERGDRRADLGGRDPVVRGAGVLFALGGDEGAALDAGDVARVRAGEVRAGAPLGVELDELALVDHLAQQRVVLGARAVDPVDRGRAGSARRSRRPRRRDRAMPSPWIVGRSPNVRVAGGASGGRPRSRAGEDVGKCHGRSSSIRVQIGQIRGLPPLCEPIPELSGAIRSSRSCDSFAIIKECPPPRSNSRRSATASAISASRTASPSTSSASASASPAASCRSSRTASASRSCRCCRRSPPATGVELADLLAAEPPNRRAALEIELERAQCESGLPPARARRRCRSTQGHDRRDARVDRRPAPRAAAPRARGDRDARGGAAREHRAARCACATRDNYLPEIEQLAEEQLKAAGPRHGRAHPPHGEHHGRAARLRAHLRERPARTRPARSPTSRTAASTCRRPRSPAATACARWRCRRWRTACSATSAPTDYAEFLQQRLEINYFAAACLMPRDGVGRVPRSRRRRTATSPSRTSATRSASPTRPRRCASPTSRRSTST